MIRVVEFTVWSFGCGCSCFWLVNASFVEVVLEIYFVIALVFNCGMETVFIIGVWKCLGFFGEVSLGKSGSSICWGIELCVDKWGGVGF